MAKGQSKGKDEDKGEIFCAQGQRPPPIQPPRGRERTGQAEGAPEAVIRGQPSPRRGF